MSRFTVGSPSTVSGVVRAVAVWIGEPAQRAEHRTVAGSAAHADGHHRQRQLRSAVFRIPNVVELGFCRTVIPRNPLQGRGQWATLAVDEVWSRTRVPLRTRRSSAAA
jgi:hypothetical protein